MTTATQTVVVPDPPSAGTSPVWNGTTKQYDNSVISGGGLSIAGTGFVPVVSSVVGGTARAVDLSTSDITNLLPLAHQAAPTGSGYIKGLSGGWVGSAQAVPIPVVDGGWGLIAPPGNPSEVLINSGGTAYSAATNVRAGSSFVSWGSGTVHASALLRFGYNFGSSIVVGGAPDSTATDRSWLTYGPGDAWTQGNNFQDWTIRAFTVLQLICVSGPTVVYGNNTVAMTFAQFQIQTTRPIRGDSSFNAPWGSDGNSTITMASASHTVSPAEFANKILRVTGALGTTRNLVLPSVATGDGYTKEVWCDINEDHSLILTTGTGKTATMQGIGSVGANICRMTISVSESGVIVHGKLTSTEVGNASNT